VGRVALRVGGVELRHLDHRDSRALAGCPAAADDLHFMAALRNESSVLFHHEFDAPDHRDVGIV
jgi:hypothetical protein